MAETETFDSVDINTYTKIPNTTMHSTMALGRALRLGTPEVYTEQIDIAAVDLDEVMSEVEEGMLDRRRQEIAPLYGASQLFDGGVDALWGVLRARMVALRGFEHPGLDPVVASGSPYGQQIEKNRRKSERAQELVEALFGDGGLRFTNLPFREQAEVMATLIALIDEKEIEEELDQLAGITVIGPLRGCQELYRQMVADRLSGETFGPTAMTKLRRRLSRAIVQYNIAVYALLNRKKPETLALVTTALKPVIVLRQRVAEGRIYAGGVEQDSQVEVVDEELDEDQVDDVVDDAPAADVG